LTRLQRKIVWCAAALVWATATVGGLSLLWRFDNTPGAGAVAPTRWPADSGLARSSNGPTLLLVAHPQCSCTRASLDELSEALARARTRPKTYVLFLKPDGVSDGWEQTASWQLAASIPGVIAMRDTSGREAQLFGAATSGETLLYDADGVLIFSGGITAARGHAGDNAGRSELVSLLNHGRATTAPTATATQPHRDSTSVFGCPLFGI